MFKKSLPLQGEIDRGGIRYRGVAGCPRRGGSGRQVPEMASFRHFRYLSGARGRLPPLVDFDFDFDVDFDFNVNFIYLFQPHHY
jgi:hypothetical protein